MKRSEVTFISVLIAFTFILAACTVAPGEAIRKSKPSVDTPPCAGSGQSCGNFSGNITKCCGTLQCLNGTCYKPLPCRAAGQTCGGNITAPCCGALNCVGGICAQQPSCATTGQSCINTTCCSGLACNALTITCANQTTGNQTYCTPGYQCLNSTTSRYRLSNCTYLNFTNCQYGCNSSIGTCNPPLNLTCEPSVFCGGNYTLNYTLSNCTSYYTNCVYGCNSSTNYCNPPEACSPIGLSTCVNATSIAFRQYNCSYGAPLDCPYGCNASTNLCSPAPGCVHTCFDSDGGINLTVKGNVSGVSGNGTSCNNYFMSDGCAWSPPGAVAEWYCVGGQASQLTYYCPSGQTCVNGACQ